MSAHVGSVVVTSNSEKENDLLDKLKNDAEDEHRNYLYPDQAQDILNLIKRRDQVIVNQVLDLIDARLNGFPTDEQDYILSILRDQVEALIGASNDQSREDSSEQAG